jgi:hypothetical protein
MASCCENSNEPSGSKQCGILLPGMGIAYWLLKQEFAQAQEWKCYVYSKILPFAETSPAILAM